jgi:hypothetical protein
MKKILTLFALTFFTAGYVHAQGNDENLVRKAFENYKSAILNENGEEAFKYINSGTANYYTYIIDLIKTADSTKIDSLSLLDKITVFSVRHRASKEEIIGMDGKSVFVYAIENGMIGKNSVENNKIGGIAINNEFATGQLIVNGQKTPFNFHFYKEMNEWKVDLTSIFPVTEKAFKQVVAASGEKENDYIFNLLDLLTGKKPGSEIWRTVL